MGFFLPHRSRRVFSIFKFSKLFPFSDFFEASSRKKKPERAQVHKKSKMFFKKRVLQLQKWQKMRVLRVLRVLRIDLYPLPQYNPIFLFSVTPILTDKLDSLLFLFRCRWSIVNGFVFLSISVCKYGSVGEGEEVDDDSNVTAV